MNNSEYLHTCRQKLKMTTLGNSASAKRPNEHSVFGQNTEPAFVKTRKPGDSEQGEEQKEES